MGKAYNKIYHLKGSGTTAGRMVCESCKQKIDGYTQDWLEAKRDADGDWGYVSWHRACVQDHSGWLRIEKEIADKELEVNRIVESLSEYLDEDERFNDCFTEALSRLGLDV